MIGLAVIRPRSRTKGSSSSLRATLRAAPPASSTAWMRPRALSSSWASLLVRSCFLRRSRRFSIWARSARPSSRLITSASRAGSTLPDTWMTSSSSKQRTTWTIASTSRMLARNLLPRPSPWLAPFTRPAISTNSTRVGTSSFELEMAESLAKRGSGTATTPTLGSIVQKGKLAAWAWALATRALKRVDLPTLGSPTIPALSMGEIYPRRRTQFCRRPGRLGAALSA